MSAKNWNFSFKKDIKQNILDTISLWAAIGLLWFAFISIIGEHFPFFLKAEVLAAKSSGMDAISFVGQENFETLGMDGWVISLFIILLFVGFEWPKKYLKTLTLPCRLVAFGVPIAYIITKFEQIEAGMLYIINAFIPHVNSYYHTRFSYMQGAAVEDARLAFTAITMVLWGLLWLLAYGCKRRILLVIFPVIALGSELAVGLSPVKGGLLYTLFAAILLALLGGTSVKKKVLVLAGVWVCVCFAGIFFKGDIEKLSTLDSKHSLLRWQKNLSLDDLNPFKWLNIDFHFNWEQLNNEAPEYTGKVILEIESDKKPESPLYLKGFYGTNYENGNWSYDDSVFKKACREAGKKPQKVAEQIFQMPYERRYEYEGGSDTEFPNYMESKMAHYKISYVGATGDVAYAPYVSDYTSMDDSYTFLGDYLLKKSVWDKSTAVTTLNSGVSIYDWEGINNSIAIGTFGYNQNMLSSYHYREIDLTEQLEELEWVNSLAEGYLQVPEDREFLIKIGEQLEKYLRYYSDKTVWVTGMEDTNYCRLVYASLVAQHLEEKMSYSLKLDNLPYEADPIEYALTKSYEGYCMHFASAATLLLREAGVPARYVSGYTVAPSAFSMEGVDVYKANVCDFMAHAWVEIYLDNIGWVPIEVTPGGSLDSLPTGEEMERWENTSTAHRQDMADQEEPPKIQETETDSEGETESEDSESEERNSEANSESEGQQRPQNRPNGVGAGKSSGSWLKVLKGLCILAVLAVVGFFAVRFIRGSILFYNRVLELDMKKNKTRKAVKRMNRRLYYLLRFSRVNTWFGKRWTDAEYKKALAERFTDVEEESWDRYMDIVKKNHYSHEVITTEEMQYCYECYKKAKVFHEKVF